MTTKNTLRNLAKRLTVGFLAVVTAAVTLAPITAAAKSYRSYDNHTKNIYWDAPGFFQSSLGQDDIKDGEYYALHCDRSGILHVGVFATYDLVQVVKHEERQGEIPVLGSHYTKRYFQIKYVKNGETKWIRTDWEGLEYIPLPQKCEAKDLYKVDYAIK